jgi:ACS family tartrate transporter-like MFS transporter
MKDLTGSYAGGLYGLALLSLVSAVVCALFLHIPDVITPAQRGPGMAPTPAPAR